MFYELFDEAMGRCSQSHANGVVEELERRRHPVRHPTLLVENANCSHSEVVEDDREIHAENREGNGKIPCECHNLALASIDADGADEE